jgi:hypothetical protein
MDFTARFQGVVINQARVELLIFLYTTRQDMEFPVWQ